MNHADLSKNLEALSAEFLSANGKIANLLQEQLVAEGNDLRAQLDAKQAQIKRLEEEETLRLDNLRVQQEDMTRLIKTLFTTQLDALRTEEMALRSRLTAVVGNAV